MKSKTASFGSVSSGTLRSEDLIPAFARELRALRGALPKSIYQGIREFDAAEDYEFDGELVEELTDALQEFAPPYAYFGAHPGDGADFGFWLSEGWEQDFKDGGGLKVNDTGDVPADYSGEVLHVSDHGNPTLYAARNGELREIWSLV